MKKIMLITTGGTIAGIASDNGLVPGTDGRGILDYIPDLSAIYDIEINNLLTLDSSNIHPEQWQLIAREVAKHREDYDAIIITHGTDTLAYTASVLSYMLMGISIPVILTGSQLPISHPLTDAITNLRSAFEMANESLGGVFVAFDRDILLGCRSVKVRTSGFKAFESINSLAVGNIDASGLNINYDRVMKYPAEHKFTLLDKINPDVFLLKLTPGINPRILLAISGLGFSGLVIEAFGSGGISFIGRDLISMLDELIAKDIPVVVCSQCLYDTSDLTHYEVGRKALEKGVISAFDMTTESVVTKLMWGLGQIKDEECNTTEYIRELFSKNLAGEISAN